MSGAGFLDRRAPEDKGLGSEMTATLPTAPSSGSLGRSGFWSGVAGPQGPWEESPAPTGTDGSRKFGPGTLAPVACTLWSGPGDPGRTLPRRASGVALGGAPSEPSRAYGGYTIYGRGRRAGATLPPTPARGAPEAPDSSDPSGVNGAPASVPGPGSPSRACQVSGPRVGGRGRRRHCSAPAVAGDPGPSTSNQTPARQGPRARRSGAGTRAWGLSWRRRCAESSERHREGRR